MHHVSREEEILLEGRGGGGGAVDIIEGGEGGRGPDDEAAEVAPRGQLQQVHREDGVGFHAGDVAEGAHELLAVFLRVVDHEGAAALAVAPPAQFSFSGAEFAGGAHFADVRAGADGGEEGSCCGGFGDGGVGEGAGGDYEGDFGDGADLVAAG